MKEALISATAQIITTLVIAILGVIGAWLAAKLGHSAQLNNIQSAVNAVIKMAQLTAQELQQTIVDGLKTSSSDGKLTEKDVLYVQTILQTETRNKLSKPVCDLITAAGIDLSNLIAGAAEAWITKSKNTV